MTDPDQLFVLLLAFQAKHMAFEPVADAEPGKMRAANAGSTLLISLLVLWDKTGSESVIAPLCLASIDFFVRSLTDFVKSERYKDVFWVQFLRFINLDHRIHHLTHYGIIYFLTQHGISP